MKDKMNFMLGSAGFMAALMAANAFSQGSILSTVICCALLIFIYKLIKLEREDHSEAVIARLEAVEANYKKQLELEQSRDKKIEEAISTVKATVALRSTR